MNMLNMLTDATFGPFVRFMVLEHAAGLAIASRPGSCSPQENSSSLSATS